MDNSVFHDLLLALPPVGQQDLQAKENDVMCLDALHPPCYCTHCDLRYAITWFEKGQGQGEGLCFFCTRFRTPRITRFALLRETEWFFLRSGESDARVFYDTYFYYLHRWADRFCVNRTKEEVMYQEELRRSVDS